MNLRVYLLSAMVVLLGLVIAGSFYVGASYACGDGVRDGLRCVDPVAKGACYSCDGQLYAVEEPPTVCAEVFRI